MINKTRSFLGLTAGDLMSRNVVTIPKDMPLRSAAHLLSQNQISGAPVVGPDGKCVGVLSASDFVRWAEDKEQVVAGPTYGLHFPWEAFDFDFLPREEVNTYMTPDPIMIPPNTKIGDLAQMLLDAHVRRVIVIDPQQRPLGIVSATDIVAAVALASRISEEESLKSDLGANNPMTFAGAH